MRSRIVRQEQGVATGPATAVFLVDLDGVAPVTLYVENVDQKAALIMREGGSDAGNNTANTRAASHQTHGSKNGNLKFEAVVAGTSGNSNTIEITAAPSQAFSITNISTAFTINLLCDASGKPIQTALQILNAIENASGAGPTAYRAAINTFLAPGSDGSGSMEVLASDATHVIPAATALAGGTAATATSTATIEVSPTGAEDGFPGPWVADSGAGSALSTVTANSAKQSQLTGGPIPVKGLRVTILGGSGASWIVLSVIAEHKQSV